MATKLFVTGATGYIGGDALFEINKAHPEWEITAMVRNSDKGALVAKSYPKIKLVYGDLDSTDLIEEQAAAADIVYHFANCDHVASAQAIVRGLARSPSYLIHTSGTGMLAWKTMQDNSWGEAGGEVYDDWSGVDKVTSIPDQAIHRNVDKIVLAANQSNKDIKTAIVCPPAIYGQGRGPGNTRSIQLYLAAKATLERKQGFTVGKGENRWGAIHVADLSRLYVRLGEAAVAGGEPATWNENGYYFAEHEIFKWGDVTKAVADEARKQGYLESQEIETLGAEQVSKHHPFAAVLLGTDSVGHSQRAKKLLAWQPQEQSIFKEVPAAIELEARALGLLKSHAEKVEQ